MKKVAIIGTAGVPARYGGFETLVHQLVIQWKDKYDVGVYCSTKYYKPEERIKTWNGARLFYLPLNANGIQSILYDIVSVIHALFWADTLVILGVSGGIVLPFVKFFTKKKIIVNIDGLEWRRPKWNKWVQRFLKFSEFLAVKYSDVDITDNAALKRYTAINYGTLSYLVAYGADHVKPRNVEENDFEKYPFLKNDYAFKVCRIEPENNLHLILEAFAKNSDKVLVVVGNWNNSEYGMHLKRTYATTENIILLDPIYEQLELDLLRSNCSLYVHGHSAGGTNPSLVEAMYLGLPILAFDVVYNRATMCHKGMYFKDVDSLSAILTSLTKDQLDSLAIDMKLLANEFYTWEVIADKYHALILSLYNNYSKTEVDARMSKLPKDVLRHMNLLHLKNTRKFYKNN